MSSADVADALDLDTLGIIADRLLEPTSEPVAEGYDNRVEGYRAIYPLLTRRERAILAGMIEVCPIHQHDWEICLDELPVECLHLTRPKGR